MPRSFSVWPLRAGLANRNALSVKDPRVAMRALLGTLALANIVAALIVFKPWGGSPEDLERQRGELAQQAAQLGARLERSRQLVSKVEKARAEGDRFLNDYMMDRRTTFSTIVAELDKAASQAGIKPRERSMSLELVEGSDSILQMTITSGFEGTYANLTNFINLLDRSPRFLIIESLQAAPQQASGVLSISIKLDTFVRQLPGSAS
jgi:type IV pilus assembly protein PilO